MCRGYVVVGHNVGNLDSEKGVHVHGKALPITWEEAITDTRTLVAFRDQRGNGLTNYTGGNRQVRSIVVHTLEMAPPAEEEFKKNVGEAHSNGNDKPLRGLNTFG